MQALIEVVRRIPERGKAFGREDLSSLVVVILVIFVMVAAVVEPAGVGMFMMVVLWSTNILAGSPVALQRGSLTRGPSLSSYTASTAHMLAS